MSPVDTDNVFGNNALIKTFNAHNIHIFGTLEEPLFRASEIGDLLDMVNIRATISSFDEDEKGVNIIDTPGGQQDVVMLTEQGLYKLLMISRKPIAKQFQKWVFSIIKEVRLNGKYDHEKTIEAQKSQIQELEVKNKKLGLNITSGEVLMKTHAEIIRHNSLIDAHIGNKCVYIGKVKDLENDEYIVKIGSTYALNTRKYDLKSKFIDILFIDVFACDHNYEEFEKTLQHHELVRGSFFSIAKSKETFKISNKLTYGTLLNLAKKLHVNYKGVTSDDIREDRRIELRKHEIDLGRELLEKTKDIDMVELIKMVTTMQKNHDEMQKILQKNLEETQQNHVILMSKLDSIESRLGHTTITPETPQTPSMSPSLSLKLPSSSSHDITPVTNPRGPRVQLYSENGTLIQTFASFIDALRSIPGSSRSSIVTAAKDKSVYRGHRWHLVDPAADDIAYDIGATNTNKKIIRKGHIAMLNLARSEIVDVFPDQKTASAARQMANGAAICKAIRDKTVSSGHFFEYLEDCRQELQDDYLSRRALPDLPVAIGSVTIRKLDAHTGNIVETYASIADVIKQCQVSRLSLKKAIGTNKVFKGFRWSSGTTEDE